jgi:sugar porter (SP) family MFS transporter
MLGIETLPAVAYLFALALVPESPRWLAMRGRDEEATEVLGRVAGADAGGVLREVKAGIAAEAALGQASWRVLLHPSLRLVMTVGIVVGILQQITGINAVFFYAPMIFEQSGIGTNAAFMQAALVGLVNLAFTVVAMALIDRFGRRPLLGFGLSGIAVCMLLLAWAFVGADDSNPRLILFAILGFVASFAVSLGPVMWVLFSELFPNRVRGVAISFVGLVNSATAFLVTLVFPWQLQSMGSATTFLLYGLFALAGLVFVMRILPETKGRSLEELEAALVRT